MMQALELEFDTFDLDDFKQKHPDLVAEFDRFVKAVERAKESGKVDMAAIASVRMLRDKEEAKFRAGLRAARGAS